jgi:hypothetical protein
MKNLLSQICDKLKLDVKENLPNRPSTPAIFNYLITNIPANPPVLIVDNLAKLKATDVETFLNLVEKFPVLAATEETIPRLKRLWWKFKVVELKPLTKESCQKLIKHLTKDFAISDYELMETKLLNLANGR